MFAKTQGSRPTPIRIGSRAIDLNNPALKDMARREQNKILTQTKSNTSEVMSKATESKTRIGQNNIFEGLDNKNLLDHQTLKKATHKDIFGSCQNEHANSDEKLMPVSREITSLKKQLNYMNFSKQEMDPINSK